MYTSAVEWKHALVALLRAAGVPAGLCYQRLAGDGSGPLVHGLEEERLAWITRSEFSEVDYPVVHAVPHPAVLEALRGAGDRTELWRMLPTWPLNPHPPTSGGR